METKTVQFFSPVSLKHIDVNGGFWGDRIALNRNRTIPAITHQMQATGRLDAWHLDWEIGKPKPHIFWDSDTGKWLEAIGYSLTTHPDPELEREADRVIDLIAAAQQPDGYLNIFFTAVEPENRWRNLRDWHELYDAGHLIEGALAYYGATGKRKLLDVMERYVEHIDQRFGPREGQRHGYCGHPEVEMALVRLYRATGSVTALNLAKYFVDERGRQPHYFDLEARERGDDPAKFWATTYRYCQAHVPVREQKAATGHSVRASYLYSAVADLFAETGDQSLLDASRAIWDDLTAHQMYITSGIGPAHANEGFTFAYDLPNETAYAETCASIALVFWAQRMFNVDPDSKYIDVMERALYNNVLAGVSFEGDRFFYANPLASFPSVNPFERFSGINTAQHYRRSEWFDCACCPPNLARLIASVGSYFYSVGNQTAFVHLYGTSRATLKLGAKPFEVEQVTNYPWDGDVKLQLKLEQPGEFTLALRIPGWARSFGLTVNGVEHTLAPVRGYVHVRREWHDGDTLMLTLPMPVERMVANPAVRQDAGCVALQRGPVVYCLEEADNGPELANVVIPRHASLHADYDESLLGGVSVIRGEAVRVQPAAWTDGLYKPQYGLEYDDMPITFQAIPYSLWANRQPGEMRVWVRES
ncbi:MAG: glycoside hydrolase family 127 protein [Chloroflexi bacterium]|nr:glycoside hydrolase family 127 protein [Chloroflexota bacterium]